MYPLDLQGTKYFFCGNAPPAHSRQAAPPYPDSVVSIDLGEHRGFSHCNTALQCIRNPWTRGLGVGLPWFPRKSPAFKS